MLEEIYSYLLRDDKNSDFVLINFENEVNCKELENFINSKKKENKNICFAELLNKIEDNFYIENVVYYNNNIYMNTSSI